jgi:hypothetical protein
MKRLFTLGALVLAAIAARTQAAPLVTFSLVTPDSTHWQLFVQDSLGDNDGIFSIGATIINADSTGIGHLQVTGPTGQIAQDPGTSLGFTGLAQSSVTVDAGTGNNFAIYQPVQVNDPGEYVYGVGQSAGSFTAEMAAAGDGPFTAVNVSNDGFSAACMIAQGTNAPGSIPSLYMPDLSADVFVNTSSTVSGAAVTVANTVPEPASMVLVVLGGVLLIGRSRRQA